LYGVSFQVNDVVSQPAAELFQVKLSDDEEKFRQMLVT
jgi:hypothetical protein